MKIEADWARPVPLRKDKSGTMVYDVDLEKLPAKPGVYVFARIHGKNVIPLYIGQSLSIRARIKGHLNSLKLMRAIEDSQTGRRVLICCTVKARSKERAQKHCKIIEKALILHAQSEGHELLNISGTKLPTHAIDFTTVNSYSKKVAPKQMRIERALTRRATKPRND